MFRDCRHVDNPKPISGDSYAELVTSYKERKGEHASAAVSGQITNVI